MLDDEVVVLLVSWAIQQLAGLRRHGQHGGQALDIQRVLLAAQRAHLFAHTLLRD